MNCHSTNMKKTYQIINDGQIVCEGNYKEVAEYLGIKKSTMYYTCQRGKPYMRYGVKYYIKEANKKSNNEYESVKEHLFTYGNTVMVKNPTEAIERLKQEGINVSVVHYPKKRESNGDWQREDWILTRV